MRGLRIFILIVGVMGQALAYASGTHEGQGDGNAEDFLGVVLNVSVKVQDLTGIKAQPAIAASSGMTINVAGRLVENMERTVEVSSPVKGVLQEYLAVLGEFVVKDAPIARIRTQEGLVELKASSEGVLAAQFILPGEDVSGTVPVAMLADLSRLAAHVDIYEKDIALIKRDQRVLLRVSAYPGELFEGRVDFVSPRIDEASVTLKARVQVDNGRRLLKPGMFVQGEVLAEDKADHLIVPVDALQTIEGVEVVFVQEGDLSFMPVKVVSRPAAGRQILIKGDIKAGDRIVTQGSFILKSKILENEIAGGHCH